MVLLTVPEVAHKLGVTSDEVWGLIRSGELELSRAPGGSVRVAADELARFADGERQERER